MEKRKESIYKSVDFWVEKLQNQLFREIENYLEVNKMTKQDFAKKLGVSKGYVSQILNGNFSHSIEKLIQLSIAIDKVPFLQYIDEKTYKDVLLDCKNYTVFKFNETAISGFNSDEMKNVFDTYKSLKKTKRYNSNNREILPFHTDVQMKYVITK